MGFVKEFKEFAMRGNVLDMAVGIVIGGAFGKIVSSFVADLMTPLLGLLVGGVNFSDLKIVLKQAVMQGEEVISPEVAFSYGNFIQVVFDFLIIALAIFILLKVSFGPRITAAGYPMRKSLDREYRTNRTVLLLTPHKE